MVHYYNFIPFHKTLPHFHPCASIKAHIDVAMVVEERLEDIEHLGHLGEDQHPVAASLESAQQVGEDLQLAAVVLDQPGVGRLHCEPANRIKVRMDVTSCSACSLPS